MLLSHPQGISYENLQTLTAMEFYSEKSIEVSIVDIAQCQQEAKTA